MIIRIIAFILQLIGTIWSSPIGIPYWLFYILPLWALGHISFAHKLGPWIWVFSLSREKENWYTNLWTKYAGSAGPNAIIIRDDYLGSILYNRVLNHEERHCVQIFLFGIFMPILYLKAMLFIYLFCARLDPYRDNPFEVDARSAEVG